MNEPKAIKLSKAAMQWLEQAAKVPRIYPANRIGIQSLVQRQLVIGNREIGYRITKHGLATLERLTEAIKGSSE